jgi:hypothetical protein
VVVVVALGKGSGKKSYAGLPGGQWQKEEAWLGGWGVHHCLALHTYVALESFGPAMPTRGDSCHKSC